MCGLNILYIIIIIIFIMKNEQIQFDEIIETFYFTSETYMIYVQKYINCFEETVICTLQQI